MGMHGKKKLYGTATIGTKGQVVIPADAREELNLKTGDKLYVINTMHGGGVMFLKEDMLEDIVAHLSEQIEGFRAFKEQSKEK
jgi:AbrB family looped-hinge helix DNA binding protein|tara:strand:+ start:410 stop:658 length:249 start_codon:yes stop_codon:yes gene_type:complete